MDVLTPDVVWQAQALYDFAVFKVRFNNVVNIVVIHKAIPNAFWIYHRHRATRAAV